MKPLFQIDLDRIAAAGCQNPNCKGGCAADQGILFLHPRCHQNSGVQVSYEKGSGALTISCNRCERPLAAIAVAMFPHD